MKRHGGPVNYMVKLPLGVLKTFYVNLLKTWIEDDGMGVEYRELELASSG